MNGLLFSRPTFKAWDLFAEGNDEVPPPPPRRTRTCERAKNRIKIEKILNTGSVCVHDKISSSSTKKSNQFWLRLHCLDSQAGPDTNVVRAARPEFVACSTSPQYIDSIPRSFSLWQKKRIQTPTTRGSVPNSKLRWFIHSATGSGWIKLYLLCICLSPCDSSSIGLKLLWYTYVRTHIPFRLDLVSRFRQDCTNKQTDRWWINLTVFIDTYRQPLKNGYHNAWNWICEILLLPFLPSPCVCPPPVIVVAPQTNLFPVVVRTAVRPPSSNQTSWNETFPFLQVDI